MLAHVCTPVPAEPKTRLKSDPRSETKLFAAARQPKGRERKKPQQWDARVGAARLFHLAISPGHILQRPSDPAVGSLKMLSYVTSAQTHVLTIKVPPPEDRELSDVTRRPSINPDHLSIRGLSQCPPPHPEEWMGDRREQLPILMRPAIIRLARMYSAQNQAAGVHRQGAGNNYHDTVTRKHKAKLFTILITVYPCLWLHMAVGLAA